MHDTSMTTNTDVLIDQFQELLIQDQDPDPDISVIYSILDDLILDTIQECSLSDTDRSPSPTTSTCSSTKKRAKPKCSICRVEGHNRSKCPSHTRENGKDTSTSKTKSKTTDGIDPYTEEILREAYELQKNYAMGRKRISESHCIVIRLPIIPEDISENIIKFAIHRHGDTTSSWNCKSGDLFSEREGKQECKCFTSDGPPSFTPSSDWDVIYFMDARRWLEDHLIIYRVQLKKTSEEWKKIKVNKDQTFEDQCQQGRRPRITWDLLYPQISEHCTTIFDGPFNDLFSQKGSMAPAGPQ